MGSPRTVSVVIPNYNRAETLGAAITSALGQSGADVEVLVCDDGSTDASEQVVRDLADPRVKWLPGAPSGGPSSPRNRGVAAATGAWVAFLDSDDEWLDGKLAAQLELMAREGAAASSTNAERYLPGSSQPPVRLFESLPSSIDLDAMLRTNLVITSSMVVSTGLLREVGGFPVDRQHSIFEDYTVWLRVADRTQIVVVDKPLVRYRDESATSYRGQYALELVCAWNALADFRRWRRDQPPAEAMSWQERQAMTRQLASLVSVRAIGWRLARSLRSGGL